SERRPHGELEAPAVVVEGIRLEGEGVVEANRCAAEDEEAETDAPVGVDAAADGASRAVADLADIVEEGRPDLLDDGNGDFGRAVPRGSAPESLVAQRIAWPHVAVVEAAQGVRPAEVVAGEDVVAVGGMVELPAEAEDDVAGQGEVLRTADRHDGVVDVAAE